VPDKETFAVINASLNGLCTLLLVAAYVLVRRRRYVAHGWTMGGALGVGAAFLASYLTSKFVHGEVSSGIPEGWYRFTYLYLVLLPHTLAAAASLPLILVAVGFAALRWWAWHRSVVRWAYPIWLYVAVTGVLIYFMLYQWYPAIYPEAFRASPLFR
jgi:uncharacterized membrane protein YozB (DUF420 family)